MSQEQNQHYTNDIGYDFAIHSDFLVHWTGKDIEEKYNPYWDNGIYSRIHEDSEKSLLNNYLERLRDILKYGFWMIKDGNNLDNPNLNATATPQTCFTELKLSQARRHARQYGRLGIGVKRGYLLERGGRPIIYYGFKDTNHNDPFVEACQKNFTDRALLNFFKPMNKPNDPLNYALYAESEWRIICKNNGSLYTTNQTHQTVDTQSMHPDYFASLTNLQKSKLEYLLPLTNWLGIIIYPSLSVKKAASDTSTAIGREIQQEIKKLVQTNHPIEKGIWPIEVDLDACRNF